MKKVLIILLIVIAGGAAAYYFLQSDTRLIKKQFSSLSGFILKEGEENPVMMAIKIKNIGSLFDKKCLLEVEKYRISGSYSPEQIRSYAATARTRFSDIKLKFYDMDIEFPGDRLAQVTLTTGVEGTSKSGEAINDTHEMAAEMKKVEKVWLFNRITVVEVLQR